MKRTLLRLLTFFIIMFLSTSCERNMKLLTYYVISNVSTDVNLRSGPGTSFEVVMKVPEGEKVYPVGEAGSNGDWYHVRTAKGDTGYIHKSYITTVTIKVKKRPGELLAEKGQKVSVVFTTIDQWRLKYDNKTLRSWLVLSALVLTVLLTFLLKFMSARWWHYLIMTAISALLITALLFCDLTGSVKSGTLVTDIIFGLIFLASPFLLLLCMKTLLSDSFQDTGIDDDGIGIFVNFHTAVSLLSVLFCILCFKFFHGIADLSILICLAFQTLVFIIFFIVAIRKHILRTFFIYTFAFTLSLPAIAIISYIFAVVALPLLIILASILSGGGGSGRSSSSGSTTTLVDQYGQHVADVDGSGLDHSSGKRYDRSPDGSWTET